MKTISCHSETGCQLMKTHCSNRLSNEIANLSRAISHFSSGQALDFLTSYFDYRSFNRLCGNPFAQEIQQHLTRANGGERIYDALIRVFWRTSANRFEHARPLRIDISTCGDTHSTLNHGPQIGDYVAKHVIGNDNVEPFRVLDEPHSGCIDMGIVALNVFVILLANFVKGTLPKIECKCQHVCLAAKCQFLVFVALASEFERISETAFDSAPSVYAFLQSNFVGRALEHESTGASVKTFVILADDHKINVLWLLVFERAEALVIQFHRPKVNVLFQFETCAQKDSLFQNAGLHIRMANRAEQNRGKFL